MSKRPAGCNYRRGHEHGGYIRHAARRRRQGATGENAVRVCAARADVIMGPVGIVIADALLGEITPAMAQAVGQSRAKKLLLPINHCDNFIVGVENLNLSHLISAAVEALRGLTACAE